MPTQGLDYAVRHDGPKLDCLADRHDVRFVARYIGGGGDWKHLTAPEVDDLAARSINIVSVHQARNTEVGDFTRPNAARDAKAAVAHARALGQPEGTAIYFAVDFNASAAQIPAILDYLHVARDVIADFGYLAGVYGSHAVVAAADTVVPYMWQTYAWSGDAVHPDANLLQYRNGADLCGGKNGRDRAFNFPGWWLPDGPVDVDFDAEPGQAGSSGSMTTVELQRALNRLGFRAGPDDGDLGPKTRLATARFQLAYGFEAITVDGVPGEQTFAAIRRCVGDDPRSDRLAPHFYMYELRSRTRPGGLKDNDCFMHRDTLAALEEWREKAGKPLGVISGYRTPSHNRAVGGASRSQHTYGDAPELERLSNIARTHLRAGRAADMNSGFRSLQRTVADRLWSGIGHRSGQTTHTDTRTWASTRNPAIWKY